VQVVNLTPHSIDVLSADGAITASYPASGRVARLSVEFSPAVAVGPGVPLGALRYGEVVGLPTPQQGVWLLVSVLVRLACPDRDDLLVVASEVRDSEGRVIGCRGLASTVKVG